MSDMDMLSDFTLIVFYNLRKNGERWIYRKAAKEYKGPPRLRSLAVGPPLPLTDTHLEPL